MKKIAFVAAAILVYVLGLLWWWPLAVAGVAAAAWRAPLGGIALGLLLDLLWGAPPGALHVVYFPWTLLAVVLAVARTVAPRFFFSRGSGTL